MELTLTFLHVVWCVVLLPCRRVITSSTRQSADAVSLVRKKLAIIALRRKYSQFHNFKLQEPATQHHKYLPRYVNAWSSCIA